MTSVDATRNSRNFRPSNLSWRNRLGRALWQVAWLLLFRPSPVPFHGWRRFLLRLFGAQIGHRAHVYPSARIFAPWNLRMGDHACLAFHVNCYCVGPINIGDYATVSQFTHLCAASHDFRRLDMPLATAPISIGRHAWVAADAFIGPGVEVGEGAMVQARSVVFRDVPSWAIVGGHPAVFKKHRILVEQ